MTTDSVARVEKRYTRSTLLARGGMADVYRATDEVLDREVALKVLRTPTANEADRRRFVAEGRILARLSHRNLVTLLDVGVDVEEPYLVMELVEGRTLADRQGERLDPAEVATLGRELALALAYAHEAGVVHRDVKPGNVLMGDDGRVLLADFGIARLIGDTSRNTEVGLLVGTAAYLSPEQVKGEDVGSAADVYALGLVLLEALTGVRAYPGTAVEAACARLTSPVEIPADLPVTWQRLLRQMTATDPALRPGAAWVAAALHSRVSADPEPTAVLRVEDAAHTSKLSRLAALAAAGVLGVGGFLFAFGGPEQVADASSISGTPMGVVGSLTDDAVKALLAAVATKAPVASSTPAAVEPPTAKPKPPTSSPAKGNVGKVEKAKQGKGGKKGKGPRRR